MQLAIPKRARRWTWSINPLKACIMHHVYLPGARFYIYPNQHVWSLFLAARLVRSVMENKNTALLNPCNLDAQCTRNYVKRKLYKYCFQVSMPGRLGDRGLGGLWAGLYWATKFWPSGGNKWARQAGPHNFWARRRGKAEKGFNWECNVWKVGNLWGWMWRGGQVEEEGDLQVVPDWFFYWPLTIKMAKW